MNMQEPLLHIHPLAWSEDERDVRAVFLRNFVTDASVGVYPHEHAATQKLRFDLCVYLTPPFDWHDRLDEVFDYDRLREGVLGLLATGHVNLLETLGERIVDMCFAFPQVAGVHVRIAKLQAHADCEVGYETRRRR